MGAPSKATPSAHADDVEQSLASMEAALEDANPRSRSAAISEGLLKLAGALDGWLADLDTEMGRAALPWTRATLERITTRERQTNEDLRRLATLAADAPVEALQDMLTAARVAVGLATRAEVRKARVRREADREDTGGQG